MKSLYPRTSVIALACCWGFCSAALLNGADDGATAIQAPQNSTTTPAFHGGTTSKHERINARAKQGDVDLIFIGDSITEGWAGSGKKVWDKYYGNRKAMNAGVGGDRTQHVLWRLDNGNIDGIHPKLAVIMIGTNNVGSNTPEDVAEGIKAIVKKVCDKLPETKILLLGIFPRGATTDEQLEKVVTRNGHVEIDPAELPAKIAAAKEATKRQREENAKASQLASEIADNKMIFYMDIGDKFLEPDGTLSKDIMPDYLHPNAKGYEIWATAIEPKVAELMGEAAPKAENNGQLSPPRFAAALVCFNGKSDTKGYGCYGYCRATLAKIEDGLSVTTSKDICGISGKVSEITWTYRGQKEGKDVYHIVRNFPSDTPQAKITETDVEFDGKRQVLFEDESQCIVMELESAEK